MADVLSIPSKPWMAHLTEYTPALSDLLSCGLSGLPRAWEELDSLVPCSSTDWSLYSSLSASHSDLHLIHNPSPSPRKPHHSQQLPGKMLNQHPLPRQSMSSRGDRSHMSLRQEEAPTAAYAQHVSPFMARPNVNGTLSSNASTYCESDLESFEHFVEPLATRAAETHTGLVHPIPRNRMIRVANNLPFLPSSEETPFSSFGISDTCLNHQALLNSNHTIQTMPNYDMGQSFDPHSHNPQCVPATSSPNEKHMSLSPAASWPLWKSESATDTWYPNLNDASNNSSWQSQYSYTAPWSNNSNTGAPSEDFNHPTTLPYGMNDGHPMTNVAPPATVPSSSRRGHPSYAPASAPPIASTELPHGYPLPSQPVYPPPSQPIYSDTDFDTSSQNQLNSLSPSSFARSTTEEGPSPQQTGEERGAIEAGMHYTDERNAFLVDCKRRGLSYKDIKRVGGFKEAESTLRGRYRTLTKSKEQRVRKPQWRDKDIRLLCDAVNIHAEKSSYSSMSINEPPKVSWKKVAEHIQRNGGSYHFGNATCKKKWCDLHGINR